MVGRIISQSSFVSFEELRYSEPAIGIDGLGGVVLVIGHEIWF